MNLTIDASDFDTGATSLMQALGGAESDLARRVIARAMKKTANWVRNQIARAVAAGIKMPVKAFREMRVSVYIDKEDLAAKVWVGAAPMEARRFGPVKWTPAMSGARAGRRTFDGSFASFPPSQRHTKFIWRRTGEAPRIATYGRYAYKPLLREPIEQVTEDIEAVVYEQGARLERRAQQQFRMTLHHELQFELSKALK